MIELSNIKTPTNIATEIATNMRARRKEAKLTQAELAKKSGVSLGSLKRFEHQHAIALESLLRIGIALECEDAFRTLFAQRRYNSIQDVINENS